MKLKAFYLLPLLFFAGCLSSGSLDPSTTELSIQYPDGASIHLRNPKDIKMESLKRNKETGSFEIKGYESSTNINAASVAREQAYYNAELARIIAQAARGEPVGEVKKLEQERGTE